MERVNNPEYSEMKSSLGGILDGQCVLRESSQGNQVKINPKTLFKN